MADSKEMMVEHYHQLLEELPSSADHTALLYHLSYLYLAKFPRLQIILRQCAFETHSLFEFSETLLMECVDVSHQMVSWLLPELKTAVENDDATLSTETLQSVKGWFTETVSKVKQIVDRYENHTHGVASCTSDVINEKAEMGKTTKEIETLEKVVNDLQMELRNTLEGIGRIEAQTGLRNSGNFFHARIASGGMSVLAAILPFAGAIVKSMSNPMAGPVTLLFNQRAQLLAQRSNLQSQQHNIQVRLTDAHLKLANLKTGDMVSFNGSKNLGNVQKWLYQIQQTLIQHNVFWKSVQVILEALNDETFANDHFIGESELKGIFLTNVDLAQEHWKAFGETCQKAKNLFRLKDKDAYKFLDSSPPLLSLNEERDTMNDGFVSLRPDRVPHCFPRTYDP